MSEDSQPLPASPWVRRFASLIVPGGTVLDLACGYGRHSRYLAGLGFDVLAVDKDEAALAGLAGVPGIRTLQADLEDKAWPLGGRLFDAIVVTNYLWRPLFSMLLASVSDHGVLIYETFMVGNESFGKPENPAFLLRPGELLEVTHRRLVPVAFEQGEVENPRPAMVQRLCAVRRSPTHLPERALP